MADEAVCIETPTRFAIYTIAAGAVLPKGTLCYLSGDYTVSATSAANQAFAGIVWDMASSATSTETRITLALDGVWDIKDSSATQTLGQATAVGGANLSIAADATDLLNGAFIGFIEEAAGASEVCRTRLTKFGSSGQL